MSTETPEAKESKELALVGKVELRIALTNTDTKLESILKTYLAPLLLKLGSEFSSVRKKVIALCQHLNERTKPHSIRLPVAVLLKQYKDTQNTLIRHFDLLYIQQGVDRLPTEDRLELLPTLIHGLAQNYGESTAQTATLFSLLLKLINYLTLPARGSSEDSSLRTKLGLNDKPEDVRFVSLWIGKLLLFTPGPSGPRRCPGLSLEDCNFLQPHGKDGLWTPSSSGGVGGGLNLPETKIAAVRFLASGAFIEIERFEPALAASAVPDTRVSDVGDDILKRATPAVSLEDHGLIERLFTTYLGTRGEHGSLPAPAPLQMRILALLCRSKRATTFVPQIIQVVKEGLVPDSRNLQNIQAAPKQGLEAARLRGQVFSFTNWVARVGSSEILVAVAPTLVNEVRSYIESQGWPQFENDDARITSAELSSRSYGYETIGLLAKSCPELLLLEGNFHLLRWLFSSLSGDGSGKDIMISIEQALASVLGVFAGGVCTDIEEPLTDFLLYQMTLQVGKVDISGHRVIRSTQYAAVRFANRCLPYNNTKARYIDVLAVGAGSDERSEVIDEGKKGLDPYWYRMLNPPEDVSRMDPTSRDIPKYTLPKFRTLVEQFFGPSTNDTKPDWQNSVSGYGAAIMFCRYILLHQALTSMNITPLIDSEWRRNIDAVVKTDEVARGKVRDYLYEMSQHDAKGNNALLEYLNAIFDALLKGSYENKDDLGDCLLEFCSLSPDSVLESLTARCHDLSGAIFANSHTMRLTASHVFGILASLGACPVEIREAMVERFRTKITAWKDAVGMEVHQVHGSVLATSYWLSRKSYRDKEQSKESSLAVESVTSLLGILEVSRDKELLAAAVEGIDQLSLYGVLSPDTIPAPWDASMIIMKLKERAQAGDEKAIFALGHFAMQCNEGEPQSSDLESIITILYSLHEQRQPELQFTVGAALSCAVSGWQSRSLVGAFDVEGPRGQKPAAASRSSTLHIVIDKVLDDCRSTKPALRQASVIWLLCLVQYCGHLDDLRNHLRACQAAFKGFLSDRDSLNQESGSRGLTLVYEKGDRALKDDLIRDLVRSFTGSDAKNSLAGSVTTETTLFEPNALPTGDGSVTTYKDIVSLASEVGDPSLVYRFMSLASNNAIWSSRAAFGRFGLSSILSDSNVDGYLAKNPKLYPALYRYRFDPNTNVRSSMNDIWTALVKDPVTVINSHFELIMDDLLKNILAKEWRVRQASCAAIADLVQGRPLQRYEKYLTQIWTLTFKVCDDIKESVRTAAMGLARVLTAVLTRSLEAGDSSAANANIMLKAVLPFLLSPSGLESSAEEVQAFALKTLLQIIKSSRGEVLRPFIADLICRLLSLLSSLEPQAINYLHLNAEKYGMTGEEIDDARLNSVRRSPMMEAIEHCLDILDERSMEDLHARLGATIKDAVGLPTKVGIARVLVSLSTRRNFIFRPYADHCLRLLRRQVLDRNDTISTSFAVACGYLARLASDEEITKLVDFCTKLYFDSEDDRHRATSGEVIFALGKHATDRFAALASHILPFVFIAKHDSYERAKELFSDTWNQNVGGSRAVMLYLKEILRLASSYLDSPRWSVKHTAASAVADVVKSLGQGISAQDAGIIWPSLERAIGGKTWDGKETVLEAMVVLAKNSTVLTDEKIANQMQTIVIRESKRNNMKYRPCALACLGDFIELRKTVNWYGQVYAITEPVIRDILDSGNEMDVDSQSGGLSSKEGSELSLANALKTLMMAINPKILQQTELEESLSQTLELVKKSLSRKARIVQDALLDGQKTLFQKLGDIDKLPESVESILLDYVPTVLNEDDGVEQTRIKAAETAIMMVPIARKGGRLRLFLAQKVVSAKKHERSSSVVEVLERVQESLDV